MAHLVALNDEIAALTRAGLPLERGLREVGRDVGGGLSAAMTSLAARMDRGASLAEAMAAEGEKFPPVYRAVVEAGLRAGRLPIALESLASFVRNYAAARSAIGLALWYPLVVLALAYSLFLLMVLFVVPRFLLMFESLRVRIPWSLRLLASLEETAVYWAFSLPLVLILLAIWWAWTGRASSLRPGRSSSLLAWFPWMRSMVVQFEYANFAQLLAILVEHQVPYPEAIALAAEASGDPGLSKAGRAVAAAVERGDPRSAEQDARAIPALLRWLLITGREQGRLADALRQVATIYRKRAAEQADKIRLLLPTILLIAIGVTATLAYALALFLPFVALLRGLMEPPS